MIDADVNQHLVRDMTLAGALRGCKSPNGAIVRRRRNRGYDIFCLAHMPTVD